MILMKKKWFKWSLNYQSQNLQKKYSFFRFQNLKLYSKITIKMIIKFFSIVIMFIIFLLWFLIFQLTNICLSILANLSYTLIWINFYTRFSILHTLEHLSFVQVLIAIFFNLDLTFCLLSLSKPIHKIFFDYK